MGGPCCKHLRPGCRNDDQGSSRMHRMKGLSSGGIKVRLKKIARRNGRRLFKKDLHEAGVQVLAPEAYFMSAPFQPL